MLYRNLPEQEGLQIPWAESKPRACWFPRSRLRSVGAPAPSVTFRSRKPPAARPESVPGCVPRAPSAQCGIAGAAAPLLRSWARRVKPGLWGWGWFALCSSPGAAPFPSEQRAADAVADLLPIGETWEAWGGFRAGGVSEPGKEPSHPSCDAHGWGAGRERLSSLLRGELRGNRGTGGKPRRLHRPPGNPSFPRPPGGSARPSRSQEGSAGRGNRSEPRETSSALLTDTVVYNIPKCHCVMIAVPWQGKFTFFPSFLNKVRKLQVPEKMFWLLFRVCLFFCFL